MQIPLDEEDFESGRHDELPRVPPSKLSARGMALIKSFEGYHTRLKDGSCRAYLDRLAKPNIWTIGYGLTEGVYEGMTLSEAEAEAALRREMSRHEAAVVRLVTVPISQNQYDALVSFSYNCGTGALSRSTLLRKLNAGDVQGARASFKMWNKAGGKVWPGLVRRRKAEADLFGADPIVIAGEVEQVSPIPEMPQKIDEPKPVAIRKTSRKWRILDWIKGLFGSSAVGTVSFASAADVSGSKEYLDTIGAFIASYGVIMLVVMCVGGYVLAQLVQHYMTEDLETGRYTPSGEA